MYEFEFPGTGIDDVVAVRRFRRAVAAMALALGRDWESYGLLVAGIEDAVMVDGYDETVLGDRHVLAIAREFFPGYRIIEI